MKLNTNMTLKYQEMAMLTHFDSYWDISEPLAYFDVDSENGADKETEDQEDVDQVGDMREDHRDQAAFPVGCTRVAGSAGRCWT